MGGLINRRGGIVNIALEGKMLLGAVFAVLVSAQTGSWVLGMVAAGVAGLVGGAVFTFCVTRLGANEILAGLGFNTLAAGLIGYALKDRGTYDPAGIAVSAADPPAADRRHPAARPDRLRPKDPRHLPDVAARAAAGVGAE